MLKKITLQEHNLSPKDFIKTQRTGTLPPLFLFHSIGGEGHSYRELTRHLDKEQPQYSVIDPYLDQFDGKGFKSLEEMTLTYANAIKEFYPKSPYNLAGWSFGGVIALETAKQLEIMGCTVSTIFLIDTHKPLPNFCKANEKLANKIIQEKKEKNENFNQFNVENGYKERIRNLELESNYLPKKYTGKAKVVLLKAQHLTRESHKTDSKWSFEVFKYVEINPLINFLLNSDNKIGLMTVSFNMEEEFATNLPNEVESVVKRFEKERGYLLQNNYPCKNKLILLLKTNENLTSAICINYSTYDNSHQEVEYLCWSESKPVYIFELIKKFFNGIKFTKLNSSSDCYINICNFLKEKIQTSPSTTIPKEVSSYNYKILEEALACPRIISYKYLLSVQDQNEGWKPSDDLLNGWSFDDFPYLETYSVPNHHHDLFDKKYIQLIADKIKRVLNVKSKTFILQDTSIDFINRLLRFAIVNNDSFIIKKCIELNANLKKRDAINLLPFDYSPSNELTKQYKGETSVAYIVSASSLTENNTVTNSIKALLLNLNKYQPVKKQLQIVNEIITLIETSKKWFKYKEIKRDLLNLVQVILNIETSEEAAKILKKQVRYGVSKPVYIFENDNFQPALAFFFVNRENFYLSRAKSHTWPRNNKQLALIDTSTKKSRQEFFQKVPSTIHYCDETEREYYRVFIFNGKFYKIVPSQDDFFCNLLVTCYDTEKENYLGKSSGQGYAFLVVGSAFEFYSGSNQQNNLHDSSFLAGRPAQFTGIWSITNGKLKEIGMHCGHYLQTFRHLFNILSFFEKNKVNLSNVSIKIFTKNKQSIVFSVTALRAFFESTSNVSLDDSLLPSNFSPQTLQL